MVEPRSDAHLKSKVKSEPLAFCSYACRRTSFHAAHAARHTCRGHSWQETFADGPAVHEAASGKPSMLGS
ncbi:hypothetical protein A8H35_16090 [Burkholderia thailandensis]|uniref:Uncharacterized protein n=1 Tax=Burkholderia thailandensis (strain ATCC 700388 / DSM 13276 / CCUG 48851 / CIP 106301 / E264) TaxID=271848 RepID=Q2SW10_BURTA|nr:hypothetical protein BTH_I2368 [Burkholderia thailandensis E264]AVR10725.1 hypothetical protein A8H31_26420 [Burkholderia thailandensis]AWY59674.1 hypothetical protein A8H35_16090 [Burkholderia thailandensis]AWY69222.1 hypothetical protein A8H36_31175 [Burkholderia thailandensis]NOK40803.1 hypothetical protein [Burkholderia thailandensis]